MPNYLNQPKSSGFRNTYTSQFVPLPLEQFARAASKAQEKQDQYREGLDNEEQHLWGLKGIADSDNQKLKEVKDGFTEAAKQLSNTDLTQRDNQETAKKLVKGIARDKDLETINYNYGQYQQYLKDKDDMMKQGTYQEYNDEFLPQVREYSKSGGYKTGARLASNIFKYEDARPTQEQYFNQMQDTGSDTIAKVADIYYKNGASGISEDRIGKQAYSSLRSYLSTTAAQQEARVYNHLVSSNKGKAPIGPNGKPMTQTDYIYGNLLSAGMERAGMKYTTNKDAALNKKRDEDKADFNFGTLQTQGANPIATNGFEFKPGDFKENGDIKGEGQGIMSHFDKTGFSFDTLRNWYNDESFNSTSEKDKTALGLQSAAKLNGMKPVDYINMKAGPDVKLTTTFHAIPGKQRDSADKLFYDMTRNSGVYNNIPAMDITTGAKGSMVELLRQYAKEGGVTNKKGEALTLSDKPSPTELSNFIEAAGIKVLGQQDPNYFSPNSYVINVGPRNIAIDPTYGGMRNATPEQIKRHKYENIKASGAIFEPDSNGEVYLHWYDEKGVVNPKTGVLEHPIRKTALKDLKD